MAEIARTAIASRKDIGGGGAGNGERGKTDSKVNDLTSNKQHEINYLSNRADSSKPPSGRRVSS